MKNLMIFCALVIFIGCKHEVDPGPITQIEYSNTIGITGATSTIIIDAQKEMFDFVGNTKKCERAITPAEWNRLIDGFDWNKFKKAKSNNEPVCCDRGGGSLKVTIRSQSHQISWTAGIPRGVQVEFVRKLSERWGNLIRVCP